MGKKEAPRRARGPAAVGTFRLFLAFGSGIVGVFYLLFAITPLASGHVEWNATVTDIDGIEEAGFPDAGYLEVRNGNVVFEYARPWLSRSGDEVRLFQLSVPVVSDAQLQRWDQLRTAGEPLDLSRLRLIAVFRREQLEQLWPNILERAESSEPLTDSPVRMDLVGDTGPAKHELSKPQFSGVRAIGLDWGQGRRLLHGVHHDSPLRVLKNLAVGLALLAVSILVFRYHRRHPTKAPPAGLDLTPILDDSLDL